MSRHYSLYKMREGDPSVYGDFDCVVLGEPLVVTVDRIEDGDPRCLDILGISGKDEFGDESAGEWVREIGWQSARRTDGKQVQSTMREPEGVVIAMHFRHPRYGHPHMSQWGASHRYVTLRGIATVFGGSTIEPADVLARVDASREGGKPLFPYVADRQRLRAVRRLLEGAIGVSPSPCRVERVGRWRYGVDGVTAPATSPGTTAPQGGGGRG